jgi:hypothetical protein
MTVRASSIAMTVAGLCVGLGCPQLKDDDFSDRSVGAGIAGTTSGIAGATGGDASGGSGSCDAGSRGCGAGAGSGGSGGAGDSTDASSPALADSGTDAREPTSCALEEATGPNGECYFADGGESTWSEARTSCQSRGTGWDLAAIGDAEESDFVLSLTGYEAWIGATDIVTEGAWLWVGEDATFFQVGADAENTRFNNWSDGEPNDFEDSDCMRILTTGLWADWPCESPLGHVCRRYRP